MSKTFILITYLLSLCLFVINFEFLVMDKLHYLYITSGMKIYAWHGYSFPHLAYLIPLFFIFRRMIVWIKEKRIYVPDTFSGWRSAVMIFLISISLLAIIASLVLALTSQGSRLSGIPMDSIILYSFILTFPLMLIIEILDLRRQEIIES